MCSIVMTAVLTACASASATGGSGNARPNVITREEIENAQAKTALDAVQHYRSDLLTAHAASSVLLDPRRYPVVFIDQTYLGQIDELRNVAADRIEEIHVYTGSDATARFGARYGGGVIQLISRTGDW